MTNNGKYEALIKWLAHSAFAQAPNNTDGYIDKKMKGIYPQLNTPSGDWGLHKLLDRAFTEGYISYQEREGIKWYEITDKGQQYADFIVGCDNFIKKMSDDYSAYSPIKLLDTVLYWFALEPHQYKGGMIIPRIKVPSHVVGDNLIEFYFSDLNSPDFVLEIDLLLDQLAIDGYLYKHTEEKWRPTYSITFKGKVFYNNGGYKSKDEREKRQNRIQKVRDSLLISGTWFAGAAGLLLVVNEVLKNFHWAGTITFWTTVFVFGSGVFSGLIIYLLVMHIAEEKGR